MPVVVGEAAGELLAGDPERHLAGAGVAEAPGPERDPRGVRAALDLAVVDQGAACVVDVEGHRAPAPFAVGRPVDLDERPAVRVPQGEQSLEGPPGERHRARVDRAWRPPPRSARPSAMAGSARKLSVPSSNASDPSCRSWRGWHRGVRDRAAGEPGPVQARERLAPREERADAGRDSRTSCRTRATRSPACTASRSSRWVGDEGGGVEQHAPARVLRDARSSASGCWTPEKFDWAGKAKSRGAPRWARRGRASSARVVDAQLGRPDRHVGHVRPRARANSRMPLTELWLSNGQQEGRPGPKGKDSPTSFSAPLALRGEDDDVLFGRHGR